MLKEFPVNWVWIDCLCIIQDSTSDWLREANLMSQTYQNAVLNVSADSGEDSRAGCFVERDPLDITPLELHNIGLSQDHIVLPNAMYLFDWMSEATSFSRAWIHRERQLARRVLHFTPTEMVWECCGTEGAAFASEMLPGGAPFNAFLFGADNKYQIGRLQEGLAEGAEETYATWNDICENLSTKHLTKPSDMPIVLAGLAKDFARLLPQDTYVAGVWQSTLPHSLLWTTLRYKTAELEYIAPSWSWLSVDCAVKLANRSKIKEKHSLLKILDISTELKYEDTYGPLSSGRLQVEGVLRHIKLVANQETQLWNLCVLDCKPNKGIRKLGFSQSEKEMRKLGSSWDAHHGEMYKVELDAQIDGVVLDCSCLFVTIE